jgi:hypothetical protein
MQRALANTTRIRLMGVESGERQPKLKRDATAGLDKRGHRRPAWSRSVVVFGKGRVL